MAQHVSQHANDMQEMVPALAQLAAVAPVTGRPAALLADTGYYSATTSRRATRTASRRTSPPDGPRTTRRWRSGWARPRRCPRTASAVERMQHRLRTREGREVYAQRKCTIEPTFGIIKSVLGFRQFLLRGMRAVGHEWTLVCIGWNLKRLHRLCQAA